MNASAIALLVFACAFVAALAGMKLRVVLPDDHLDPESRDVLKLVLGLIATMVALVLSLLIASANSAYNAQSTELQSLSANVALLDRMMVYYGPDARPARAQLRDAIIATHDSIWPPDRSQSSDLDPLSTKNSSANFVDLLERLAPQTDTQKAMLSEALQLASSIAQTRQLMFEQLSASISWPFLTVLVFWLSVLFLGFGLCARLHATVTAALLVGAVSVASAIFLILELSQPYGGLMRVSDAPLRAVLTQIGR